MQNAGQDESQSGIKIARRNINNFRYAWHHPYGRKWKTKEPLGEGERGQWKTWLKTQHSKNKDHRIQSHSASSVQSLSPVWLFATPWTAARQASLSITNSRSLLRLMPIESVMPSSHLMLFCPLLLLPSILPSVRVFSIESVLHVRWPKYWSFSFNISSSNEHTGLISFRMDWLELLAVQGTLKSLLQHHSSKALILRRSAFFTVQLSHPYMTTGKTIALTRPLLAKLCLCFLICCLGWS